MASSPQVPSISIYIAGVQPGAKQAKLAKAALGVQEPEGSNLGLGALALLDFTQCQNAPQLLTIGQYMEASIGTYRAVTTVCQTTASTMAAKMDLLMAGKAPDLRIPLEVFPAYRDPAAVTGCYTSWGIPGYGNVTRSDAFFESPGGTRPRRGWQLTPGWGVP